MRRDPNKWQSVSVAVEYLLDKEVFHTENALIWTGVERTKLGDVERISMPVY